MSGDDPAQRILAGQREVARIALAAVDGFALAGSGAVREHGLIDRPTEDVDLFTVGRDPDGFDRAVDRVYSDLRAEGYRVEVIRRASMFARLRVESGDGFNLDLDLGVDWRQDEPVRLAVGPVLSLADAVGNKVAALYSRGEARDFLDVDAIRAAGVFSDDELVSAAAERDPGFDLGMFARQLQAAGRIRPAQVARYGVDAVALQAVVDRCLEWADRLIADDAERDSGTP